MRIATVSHFSRTLTLILLGLAANLMSMCPGMADVNVGPLACVPTDPNAATALAWHEHYLINPPTARVDRYVVCNIPFSTATLPSTFYVAAFGLNNEEAATRTSTCWVNVIDLRNQHVPTTFGGRAFINNPGQVLGYSRIMTTRLRADYLWSVWEQLTFTQVAAAMSDPVPSPIDATSTKGPAFWTITVKCRLTPGQALNMVKLFPTVWP